MVVSDGEWVRAPDPARRVVSATQAARVLRRDLKTVQKQIRAGHLPGGRYPGKTRWWVDAESLSKVSPGGAGKLSSAPTVSDDDLRRQLAARTAELADREETIRQLTAAAALEADRAAAVDRFSEHLLNALAEAKTVNTKSLQISAIYRDLVATRYIPDDPGELT